MDWWYPHVAYLSRTSRRFSFCFRTLRWNLHATRLGKSDTECDWMGRYPHKCGWYLRDIIYTDTCGAVTHSTANAPNTSLSASLRTSWLVPCCGCALSVQSSWLGSGCHALWNPPLFSTWPSWTMSRHFPIEFLSCCISFYPCTYTTSQTN